MHQVKFSKKFACTAKGCRVFAELIKRIKLDFALPVNLKELDAL
jgi:hypothetical protein